LVFLIVLYCEVIRDAFIHRKKPRGATSIRI
jgi:hypothetical protein